MSIGGIGQPGYQMPGCETKSSRKGTGENSFAEHIGNAAKVMNTSYVFFQTDDMLYSGGNGTGLSFYIKYAEDSTEEDPVVTAKGIDENGNEFEQTIHINRINPQYATIVEMRALEAYLGVDKNGGLSSLPPETGNMGLNDRRDFISMFRQQIKDMKVLGEKKLALYYQYSMQAYMDFMNDKGGETKSFAGSRPCTPYGRSYPWEMSFEEICALRYPDAFCYIPPALAKKLEEDTGMADKILSELDKILSHGRYHCRSKRHGSEAVILDEDGKVTEYYRGDDGFSGPTREELRQIKAEQEAKRKRREQYVRLLKESAMKRKLLEKKANERYVKNVLEEKEEKTKEKVKEREQADIEESKTDSEIIVKPDGSRVLMMTVDTGGVQTTTSLEISKPTDMQPGNADGSIDIDDLQEAMINIQSTMISNIRI